MFLLQVACSTMFLQWKLFNVITDNINIWLMWSNWPEFELVINVVLYLEEYVLIIIIWSMLSVYLYPKEIFF